MRQTPGIFCRRQRAANFGKQFCEKSGEGGCLAGRDRGGAAFLAGGVKGGIGNCHALKHNRAA